MRQPTRNVIFVQFLVSNEPCRCAGDGSREGIEELWVQTFGDRHMFLVLFGHSKLGFPAAGAFFALLWCPFFCVDFTHDLSRRRSLRQCVYIVDLVAVCFLQYSGKSERAEDLPQLVKQH